MLMEKKHTYKTMGIQSDSLFEEKVSLKVIYSTPF